MGDVRNAAHERHIENDYTVIARALATSHYPFPDRYHRSNYHRDPITAIQMVTCTTPITTAGQTQKSDKFAAWRQTKKNGKFKAWLRRRVPTRVRSIADSSDFDDNSNCVLCDDLDLEATSGGGQFQEHFFVLSKSPAMLAWSADSDDEGNELAITPNLVVETSDSKATDDRSDQYCLHLTTEHGERITLKARDQSLRNEWEREIVQLVAQKIAKSPGHKSFSRAPSEPEQLSPTKTHVLKGTPFELPDYFQPIKVIGSGAYGLVISAKNKRTGETVAIKKISGVFEDLEDGKRIVRESRLLRHLRHPQVVDILDIIPAPPTKLGRNDCRRANDVYMVLPLMDSDLHKVISSKVALTDEHVKYFLYQLLRACQHCHSKGVLHRDIKPANILVNANCDLKLCDFGLARSPPTSSEEKDLQSTMTEYVVTRWYRAPELLLCLSEYNEAIDVWSVGCVFAEMLLREPIFAGRDFSDQLELMADALWFPSTPSLEKWVDNRQALNFANRLRSKQRQRRGAAKLEHRKQQKQSMSPSTGESSSTPIKASDTANADLGLKSSLRQRLLAKGVETSAVELLMSMLEIDPSTRVGIDSAMNHPYLADLHAQHWPGGEDEEDGPETVSPAAVSSTTSTSSVSSSSTSIRRRLTPRGAINKLLGGREVQRISIDVEENDEAEEQQQQQQAVAEEQTEKIKGPVRLLEHDDFAFESAGKLTKTQLQQLMMDEVAIYRPSY
jgi:serine/threonine protein kinase